MAYAEKYGMCLNENQLWERLMGRKMFSKKEMEKVVRKMRLKIKKQKRGETGKKEKRAKTLAEMISKNDESILLVGLTGSVAAENCKGDDDIDMLIVTRKNRLWWSRFKLKWFLKNNKVCCRKYGEVGKKDAFCFNMWLEEDSLELPKEKRTEKSAVDLVLLKPLVNKGGIYEKFIKENGWATRWVATPYGEKLKAKSQKLEKRGNIDNGRVLGQRNKLINWLAFSLQYLYMWPKIEEEKVSKKRAFFHQG